MKYDIMYATYLLQFVNDPDGWDMDHVQIGVDGTEDEPRFSYLIPCDEKAEGLLAAEGRRTGRKAHGETKVISNRAFPGNRILGGNAQEQGVRMLRFDQSRRVLRGQTPVFTQRHGKDAGDDGPEA